MECLAGIVSGIAKDLVVGAVNQLRYACCFNKFVRELENERGKLNATRNSVHDRVKQAEKQTKKTAEVMDKWLEDANADIDKVDELLEKARKKKSCLFPYCPNWFCRYYLGRKLADKKVDVEKCVRDGNQYVQFERTATLPSGIVLDFPSSKNYLKFKSRQYIYEQLMEALKNEEVGMIGLYGMGGCGKTTLAMQVGNEAEADHLFDKVLFVSVSSMVDVRRIQDKIASALQYEFPRAENEERERAKRLYTRLSQENKILVILDDVWEKLNFESIGIPSCEDHKGCCKVLITTRSEAICEVIDCQKKVPLPILGDDEAWTLFQKQARISEGTSDMLKHLVRQISDECKGLPVAIAAVASTLKGKAEVDWKVALDNLTSSIPVKIEKGLQNPYKCLQLSYDNLDTEEAKSLLLLCSVFSEDEEVPVEYLSRIAIGLGIFGDVVRKYEGARNQVSATKNKLVSSCLLLDADDGKSFKMHDLVRDVAQWIGKNDDKGILRILEDDDEMTLEHSSIRYLSSNYRLPNELDFSSLEFLSLETKLEVPDEVFRGAGKLRVLFLSNSHSFLNQPLSMMSFRSLTNLRYLFLKNWELSDISFLGGLRKLEGLTLFRCSFYELPIDAVAAQLIKLRLLELYYCYTENNFFEAIGKFPRLVELYIYDGEASLELFNKFSVPQALQRYKIYLGTDFAYLGDEDSFSTDQRALCLSCFHASNFAMKDLAEKANVLRLANIQGGGLKSFVTDIFQTEGGGMSNLFELWIQDSDEIEYLVDSSNNHLSEIETLFANLVKLKIERMEQLTALWHGHFLVGDGYHFDKLEKLSLKDCPELTSLFTPNLPQLESNPSKYLSEVTSISLAPPEILNSGSFTLSSLKSLKLESCRTLGSLFTISTAKTMTSLEDLTIHDCPSLRHIAEDDHDHFHSADSSMFPNLKTMHITYCHSLQNLLRISSVGPVCPKLKQLLVHNCDLLEYIFDQFPIPMHHTDYIKNIHVHFPALEELSLDYLPNLISIVTTNSLCLTWPSLKTFKLNRCPEFMKGSISNFMVSFYSRKAVSTTNKDIRGTHKIALKKLHIGSSKIETIFHNHGHETIGQEVSSELEELELEFLYEMTYICVGFQFSFSFQNLQKLRIQRCEKLEVIFSASVLGCLPELKWLEISGCKELKQVVEDGVESNKLSNPIFPKLLTLIVQQCHKLKRFISATTSNDFPNLEFLIIIGASELEELIGCHERGKDHDKGEPKVELPKLKFSMFNHLPRLRQRIELQTVEQCCPQLSRAFSDFNSCFSRAQEICL